MLRLESLTKRFGETAAVADLSLEVRPGEFLTLLGPSGCGKTTTLRMIAGFETPTAGRILFDGKDITGLSPQRRGFGMVFQSYALFPHLDVFENVAFGLRTQRRSRTEIRRRVEEALALVDLAGYGGRRVQELSGGQQQRVALARALAPEPRVLLLDEPLSNLDAALRERTRDELRALLRRVGITAIFVTHDQEEAFALSDRIAVMRDGHLQQVDSPEALYQRPANPFVASFLGRANFLDAEILQLDGETALCALPGGARWRVEIVGMAGTSDGGGEYREREEVRAMRELRAGDRVRVMIRPEAMQLAPLTVGVASAGNDGSRDRLAAPGVARDELPAGHGGPFSRAGSSTHGEPRVTDIAIDDGHPELRGVVTERRFAGPVTHYRLRVGEAELAVHGGAGDASPGDEVAVRVEGGVLGYAGE